MLLSWLGRLLQFVLGEAPVEIRLRLARSEINELLDEGKAVGLLRPAQRQLAQAVSNAADQPVLQLGVPLAKIPTVCATDEVAQVLQVARREECTELLVSDHTSGVVQGYVSVGRLFTADAHWSDKLRPLTQLRQTDSLLAALVQLQSSGETLAEVVDSRGRPTAFVSLARLMQSLTGN